jgi:hypothetical protein
VSAGYTPTPQARKLGLRPGARVALIDPPDGWAFTEAPEVEYVARGSADLILRFVRSAADIRTGLDSLERRIFPDGAIWFAWPRRAVGHRSDVTDNAIRATVLPRGLVDIKVCAIDDDWSGLKVAPNGANEPIAARSYGRCSTAAAVQRPITLRRRDFGR